MENVTISKNLAIQICHILGQLPAAQVAYALIELDNNLKASADREGNSPRESSEKLRQTINE